MIYGITGSFASVFMLAKGYDNMHIGITLAAAHLLALVLQPLHGDGLLCRLPACLFPDSLLLDSLLLGRLLSVFLHSTRGGSRLTLSRLTLLCRKDEGAEQ